MDLDKHAKAKKMGNGVIDATGKELLPCVYEDIKFISTSKMMTKQTIKPKEIIQNFR